MEVVPTFVSILVYFNTGRVPMYCRVEVMCKYAAFDPWQESLQFSYFFGVVGSRYRKVQRCIFGSRRFIE